LSFYQGFYFTIQQIKKNQSINFRTFYSIKNFFFHICAKCFNDELKKVSDAKTVLKIINWGEAYMPAFNQIDDLDIFWPRFSGESGSRNLVTGHNFAMLGIVSGS
jgi:hypothetical protein